MRLFYERPIDAYKTRTSRTTFSLRAPNGRDAAQLTAEQKVRFKFGVAGAATPLLDLTETVNPNGSVIAILDRGNAEQKLAAVVRLTLGQADLALVTIPAGEYEGELILIEPASSVPPNAARTIARGRIIVHPSMGGALTP